MDPPLELSDGMRERICDWIAWEILVPAPGFLAEAHLAGRPDLLGDRLHALGAPIAMMMAHSQSHKISQFKLFA